jgi:hypothetical protein
MSAVVRLQELHTAGISGEYASAALKPCLRLTMFMAPPDAVDLLYSRPTSYWAFTCAQLIQ